MDRLRFEVALRAGACCVLGSLVLVAGACAARQVPPGPDPEYQRPEVAPWQEATVEDPLSNIEDEGEWVDEGPGGGTPATAEPNPEPSPQPTSAETAGEPSPAPKPEPNPAPQPAPAPTPGPAPEIPQNP